MEVILYKNVSENNCLGKNIQRITSLNCMIKGSISVINPTLIVTYDSGDINNINYCYIAEYERYYFITDITPTTGNRYIITCEVDVLESYKEEIRRLSCIIDKQQYDSNSNKYLNDGSLVVESREVKQISSFNNGFNETGTFILICAGG